MLVDRRATPTIKFAGTHLYTWVDLSTMRVKCLAQEHNTMSPARPRTPTHEATALPNVQRELYFIFCIVTYPLDRVIQQLSKWGLIYQTK